MYIFVFNWTPALSAGSKTTPPFGLIFSIFMIACMGGSSLFSIAIKRISAGKILSYVFLVASIALALPLFTTGLEATLVSFLLFEACVGIYWPAMGTVRSQVVPEETRATIYNIFRVPLNAIVLGVLLNQMSTLTAFMCCSGMLLIAFVCQSVLTARMAQVRPAAGIPVDDVDAESNKGSLLSHSDKEY